MNEKLFIVRKYIKAESAADAIRKEKSCGVDDVWIDEDWKKRDEDQRNNRLESAVGFKRQEKGGKR